MLGLFSAVCLYVGGGGGGALSVSLFVTRLVGTFSTPLASPVTEVRSSARVSSVQENRYWIYVNEVEN